MDFKWKAKYERVGPFIMNGNLAIVSIGYRFGLIDKNGDLVLGLRYSNIEYFSAKIFVVKCYEGTALFNDNGEFITDFKYSNIEALNVTTGIVEKQYNPKNLHYIIDKDRRWGLINCDIVEVFPCAENPQFVSGIFRENKTWMLDKFIKVRRNDKYGIFDIEGNEILPCIYSSIYGIGEKQKYVVTDYELYDLELRQKVLPEAYLVSDCSFFPNIIVRESGKSKGLFNLEKRKEILTCSYDEIIIKNNMIEVNNNNKKGLFALDGKKVLPCKYDKIIIENNRIIAGIKSKKNVYLGEDYKWGLFKTTGGKIASCKYNKIEYVNQNELKFYYGSENEVMNVKLKGDKVIKGGVPNALYHFLVGVLGVIITFALSNSDLYMNNLLFAICINFQKFILFILIIRGIRNYFKYKI